MQWLAQQNIPLPLAWLAIWAELVGGLALAIGFVTRVSALGIVVNMLTATIMVGLPNGLFMNWFGDQRGEGVEFYMLASVIRAVLILQGGGRWSLDRVFTRSVRVRAMLARWCLERQPPIIVVTDMTPEY
jgi:putative oxidoreductase